MSSRSIGSLSINMSANPQGFVQGIDTAQKKLGGLAKGAHSSLASIGSAFNAFSEGAGAGVGFSIGHGIAGALKEVIKAGTDFEAKMARVKAISGATGDDFEKLKHEAMELGATTEFTSSQAAQAMAVFAQAGFKTVDILQAVGPALRLATVGAVDIAQAGDIATTIIRAMRLETTDLADVTDKLAFAVTNCKTDLLGMGEALKYSMPAARIAGMTFEETTAALMLLADAGIRGSEAGTVLRNMMKKASDQSDESRRLMDLLGISFQDAKGNFIGLGKALDLLNSKFADLGGMAKSEMLGTLFEIRASTGFSTLLDQGKRYEELLGRMKKESPGKAKGVQTIQLDTVQGRFKLMLTAIEHFGIRMFDVLRGPIRLLIDGLTMAGRLANKIVEIFQPLGDLIAAALVPLGKGLVDMVEGADHALGSMFSEAERRGKGFFWVVKEGWKANIEFVKQVGREVADDWDFMFGGGGGGGGDLQLVQDDQLKAVSKQIEEITKARNAMSEQLAKEGGIAPEDVKKSMEWLKLTEGVLDDLITKTRAPEWKIRLDDKGIAELIKQGKTITETTQANVKQQLDLAQAIQTTTDALNKQLGSARVGASAAHEMFDAQRTGVDILGRKWIEATQATRDFGGQIEDLKRKGAKAEQLAPLLKMQEEARGLEFAKRLSDEASRLWTDTRTPLEQFDAKLVDLQGLLREGVIDFALFERAAWKAGEALEQAANSKDRWNAGEAVEFGSSQAVSIQNQIRFGQSAKNDRVEQVLKEGKEIAQRALMKQQEEVDLLRTLLDAMFGGGGPDIIPI